MDNFKPKHKNYTNIKSQNVIFWESSDYFVSFHLFWCHASYQMLPRIEIVVYCWYYNDTRI